MKIATIIANRDYYVFKALDNKDEKGVYHWERY